MDIKSVIFRAFVQLMHHKNSLHSLMPNRDRYSTACLVVFSTKGVTDDRDVTKIDPKSNFAYFGTGLFFMMIFFGHSAREWWLFE